MPTRRRIRAGCARSTTTWERSLSQREKQTRRKTIWCEAVTRTSVSPIALNTPFSEDVMTGHSFVSRRIDEIVPGRVYALSGYEFTEYYFVVSGRPARVDRNRRRNSAGLREGSLRGIASVCAEFAGTDHHLCNPLPLGPHRRTQLLPVRESSHSFLCPEQLSGRDSGRAKRTGDFWRAIFW